jgi:hypothetical protein
MAKDTKASRDAKAGEEWNGVAPTSFDLKALVANVALASSNDARVKRASSKSNKKAAKALRKMVNNRVRSEEKKEVLIDEAVKVNDKETERHDKAQELQLELGAQLLRVENLIKEGLANPEFVGKNQIAKIKTELKSLETLVSKLSGDDRSVANERVDQIYRSLDELDKVIQEVKKANKEDVSKTKFSKRGIEKDEDGNELKTWSNLVDRSRDDKGVVGIRKSAALAMQMLGDKAKSKLIGSKGLGGGVSGLYGKGINKMLDLAKNSPIATKAIQKLDKGVRGLTSVVKTVGGDMLKWLGKKLGALGSMLFKFLRSPLQSVGGLGNLLGLAAMGAMFIKPIFDGINGELERRFGEDYINKFISGLWSKAWGYLVDKIKSFLGIGGGDGDNSKNSDPGTTGANDGALTSSGAEAGSIVDSTTSLTPAQERIKEKALQDYRATLATGGFMQRNYEIGLTAEQKAAKTRYELAIKGELKEDATAPSAAAPSSAQAPKPSGSNGPSSATSPSTSAPSGPPVSPSTSVTNSTTSSTQNQTQANYVGRRHIAVPAESQAPMDGPKNPIIAKPSVSSPEVTSAPNAGAGGGRGGSSVPGVAQVPTHATSEPMVMWNFNTLAI